MMDVKTTCRDTNELHPVAQVACRLFLQECEKAGVKIFITETYRSQARQDYLFAQGRTRPGLIVTKATKSNHTSRLAWDIAHIDPNDLYNITVLNKAGAIARRLGITWGGDWATFRDSPHYEVKSTWKAPATTAPKPPKEEYVDMPNLFKPTSAAVFNSTAAALQRMENDKNKPLDSQWRKKLNDGTLTDSDAIGLLFVAAERGQLKI